MTEWHDFFVAEVGSSAALVGLLFVAVSLNSAKILAFKALPDRALIDFFLLMGILIYASLALVPGQPTAVLGAEILAVALLVWVNTTRLDVRVHRETQPEYRLSLWSYTFLIQGGTLPALIGGVFLILGNESGLYWLVPSVIFSFFRALTDAWVLLVEINR
jgi:hypothetical protein